MGIPGATPRIVTGYVPGAIGDIAGLHARYYAKHWNFGLFFEAKVATEMAAFLRRMDPDRDGFWALSAGDRVAGGIVMDGIHAEGEGAHLRWFIMADDMRGKGHGGRLLETAIAFSRSRGHGRIYLWTFAGLDPARHLYEKNGFRLAEERSGDQWGAVVTEQRFELVL